MFNLESLNCARTSMPTYTIATLDMTSGRHLSKLKNGRKCHLRRLWVEFEWRGVLPAPTNWWDYCFMRHSASNSTLTNNWLLQLQSLFVQLRNTRGHFCTMCHVTDVLCANMTSAVACLIRTDR